MNKETYWMNLAMTNTTTRVLGNLVQCWLLHQPSIMRHYVSWEWKGSISHFATFYMLLICNTDFFLNNKPIRLTKILDRYLKIVEYIK